MVLGIHEAINDSQAKARMTQRYFNSDTFIASTTKFFLPKWLDRLMVPAFPFSTFVEHEGVASNVDKGGFGLLGDFCG